MPMPSRRSPLTAYTMRRITSTPFFGSGPAGVLRSGLDAAYSKDYSSAPSLREPTAVLTLWARTAPDSGSAIGLQTYSRETVGRAFTAVVGKLGRTWGNSR